MTRALLVALCIGFVVVTLWAMRRGWRSRLARQSDLPDLPEVPADLGAAVWSARGLYVGSTFAGRWQDRVVHAGLGDRAEVQATLYDVGLALRRVDGTAVFVPAADWIEARLAPGLAGKVVGAGGLLVLRWRLGATELDTGFRADDRAVYPDLVRMINSKVSV